MKKTGKLCKGVRQREARGQWANSSRHLSDGPWSRGGNQYLIFMNRYHLGSSVQCSCIATATAQLPLVHTRYWQTDPIWSPAIYDQHHPFVVESSIGWNTPWVGQLDFSWWQLNPNTRARMNEMRVTTSQVSLRGAICFELVLYRRMEVRFLPFPTLWLQATRHRFWARHNLDLGDTLILNSWEGIE